MVSGPLYYVEGEDKFIMSDNISTKNRIPITCITEPVRVFFHHLVKD